MKTEQIATLEKAIQTWLDATPDDWSEVIVGDRTAELMARAACAVIDACEESQNYGRVAGLFIDTE